ncbi:hypothetical protein RND81_06G035800 [Saponaria officinalis]|uniref:CCHC-type domain-containing protein n=1 Tax=Saponaria officinalis TaxID=3572 RepID=A0AAW1K6U5_SAPOF
MSNIAKLEFVALDITGKNYLSWVLDTEIHLDARGLGETIKEGNKTTSKDKAKAMIFLRHHLHDGLKNEYLTAKDPQILWSNLKERYDHQKTVILPNDFKSISEYNSAMFRITSQLKLCGEKITDMDMLEKTYSTFHANNVVLQTQYRGKGFTKYSELISCLLVAEQNNEHLMKNHESRPTGSTPLTEANVTSYNENGNYRDHASSSGLGRGRGQWRGHGRGRGFGGHSRGRGGYFKRTHSHLHENVTNKCYRCGAKGHWSRVCRTPKHLVDLYLQSVKQKRKNVKTNMVIEDAEGDFDSGDATHLEVADFFPTPEGN